MRVPLEEPNPNCEEFKELLLGERKSVSSRIPFIELFMDGEIMQEVATKYLGLDWIPTADIDEARSKEKKRKEVLRRLEFSIECWYRLGYDYMWLRPMADARVVFPTRHRTAADTAELSKGERSWTEEGTAMITSWEDFENYDWPNTEELDYWMFEEAPHLFPEGMGYLVCPSSGFLEIPLNRILGYENLARLMYKKPDLVEAVFKKVGETLYAWYQGLLERELDGLLGFFQGDDMGFKKQTLVSPDFLRKHVLPWHKRLAELAHDNDLVYVLHSCGNLEEIMEDLIEDVGIDAKHSFEDAIIPVTEFSDKYGDRITPLGGVDMDKLARMEEGRLRRYVSGILDHCVGNGPYALGSGNSVANYVPVENYLIMLDEGLKWSEENL